MTVVYVHVLFMLLLLNPLCFPVMPSKVESNGKIKWRGWPFVNQQQRTFLSRKHNLMTENWHLWSLLNAIPKYTLQCLHSYI